MKIHVHKNIFIVPWYNEVGIHVANFMHALKPSSLTRKCGEDEQGVKGEPM